MAERFAPDEVRAYWEEQARRHGPSPAASWSDTNAIELEIRQIVEHLRDGDRVLDVGCANGFTRLRLAAARAVEIRGVDYIPEMIDQAKSQLGRVSRDLKGAADFRVGSVLQLEEADASFDRVVVVRVIINLGDWPTQAMGLRECARVLRPGGTLLLSEATLQGWRNLNVFRAEWGLQEIPMPPFNNYLDEDRVVQELAPQLASIEVRDFSSTYFVGTRILKPLLIQALGLPMDAANADTRWNRWFSLLPAFGDFGPQRLFVCTKR